MEIVRQNIIRDTTDITAKDRYLAARNNDLGIDSPYFDLGDDPTEEQCIAIIPEWHYKSTMTLFGETSPVSFAKTVQSTLGTGKSVALGNIWLIEKLVTESVESQVSAMSDQVGAEFCFMDIVVAKNNQPTTPYLRAVDRRIRYILDTNIRNLRGLSGAIPIATDLDDITTYYDINIQDPDYVVQFFGYVNPPEGGIVASRYKVNYNLLLG